MKQLPQWQQLLNSLPKGKQIEVFREYRRLRREKITIILSSGKKVNIDRKRAADYLEKLLYPKGR